MPVKSTVEISQNFVAFSEYMNFNGSKIKNNEFDYLHIFRNVILLSKYCVFF